MQRLPISLAIAIALTGISANAATLSASPTELQRRATAGDVAAERDLGQAYIDGAGVAKDVATGLAWLERAAKQRDPYAAYLLGEHYEGLPQTADNHNQMVGYYRQAAELGHTSAQIKIAQMLLDRAQTMPADQKAKTQQQALALLAFAGNAGNGMANAVLGGIYAQGQYAVAVDMHKAVEHYRKAATQKQMGAYVWLTHYYFGQGADAAQAIKYLTDSAHAGVPGAAAQLAERYANGDGAPKDAARAREWAQIAKDHNDPEADAILAQLDRASPAATPAGAIASKPVAQAPAAIPTKPQTTERLGAPISAVATTVPVVVEPVRVQAPANIEVLPSAVEPAAGAIAQRMGDIERRMAWLERQNTQLVYEMSRNRMEVTMLERSHYDALASMDSGHNARQAREEAWRHAAPKKPEPKPQRPVQAIALLNNDTRGLRVQIPPVDPDMPVPSDESHGDLPITTAPSPVVEGAKSEPIASQPLHVEDVKVAVASNPQVLETAPIVGANQGIVAHQPVSAVVAEPAHVTHPAVIEPTKNIAAAAPRQAQSATVPAAPAVPPSRTINHDADVANEQGVEAARKGEYEMAVSLFRQASMAGNPRALNNLAMSYFRGLGVDRNIHEAVAYFERAVHAGDAGAAYNLGYIYQYGVGVVPDRTRAIGWYRQAVALGNTAAHRMLGEMLSQASAVSMNGQG